MSRTATVLHVIAHMEKGGAERQLSLLVGESRHSHVIAVLPGNQRPSPAVIELLPGLSPSAIVRSVRGLIRKHRVDIVQLWLPDRLTIPAMVAARLEKRRVISGDRRRVRNYGRAAIRDRLTYVNHFCADVVVPNYPHYPPRLSLRRLLGIPARTCPVFNGIDLASNARAIRTVPERLLFVGRLVEQKRVELLLRALPALMANAGIAGLDVVGEGPRKEALLGEVEVLGLSDNVTFHGYRTDWSTMFDPGRHFLVLPSVSEGMSNTVFEAIAQGFLPIVRDSRELRAILSDWEFGPALVDMDRTEALVTAVAALTTGPAEAIDMRARAMQANLGRLSVERMAAAYDGLYDQLLTDPSATPGAWR